MPHLYSKLILPITLIFFVVSLASRVLATNLPPDPTLRGFTQGCEGKPQPCWNGIMPGKTTAEATYEHLSQLGYEIDDSIFSNTRQLQAHFPNSDCGQITANIDQRIGILYEFYVHPCEMALGAFLSAFGTPDVANLEFETCSIRLLFVEGHLQVTVANSVRPTRNVIGFGLLSDETVSLDLNRDSQRVSWAGILPMWRYKNQFSADFACP
ncbi:MAG: hypothetical protein ABI690_29690 [Chloroflexota bacterium]